MCSYFDYSLYVRFPGYRSRLSLVLSVRTPTIVFSVFVNSVGMSGFLALNPNIHNSWGLILPLLTAGYHSCLRRHRCMIARNLVWPICLFSFSHLSRHLKTLRQLPLWILFVFLVWKDSGGKTQIHIDGCPQRGVKGCFPCGCPFRLAAGTVDSLIGKLRAIFQDQDRAGDGRVVWVWVILLRRYW